MKLDIKLEIKISDNGNLGDERHPHFSLPRLNSTAGTINLIQPVIQFAFFNLSNNSDQFSLKRSFI